jgi:hypothetical protein
MSAIQKLVSLTLLAVGTTPSRAKRPSQAQATQAVGAVMGGAAQAESPAAIPPSPTPQGAVTRSNTAADAPRSPDDALKRLLEGNARFFAGKARAPN